MRWWLGDALGRGKGMMKGGEGRRGCRKRLGGRVGQSTYLRDIAAWGCSVCLLVVTAVLLSWWGCGVYIRSIRLAMG